MVPRYATLSPGQLAEKLSELRTDIPLLSPLLSLPNEILFRITFFALPSNINVLRPANLKPYASSLQLQLVCRRFRYLIREVQFRRIPLRIDLFNPLLQNELDGETCICTSCRRSRFPSVDDLKGAVVEHGCYEYSRRRINNIKRIPLQLFRWIEIHLVPQLSWLNVSEERMGQMFPEQPHVNPERRVIYEDGVWNVLESFCWISERMGGCAARSLFETVKFPSLLIQHPRTKRTPIEWHAFLRQKAVYTWQGGRYAEWWEAVSLQEYKWLGGDRARDTIEVQMVFRNLERRMMSPSRLLYWDQVKECEANCAYCTSEEHLQDRGAKESDDAFKVEPEDSYSMEAVNESIEQQLRQLLTPWPRRFALEQHALFLNLMDIQTEFLLRKHTKDKRGGIKHAERLLKQWINVKNDCAKIIDKVGATGNTGHTWAVCNKFSDFPSLENEKEKIWALISSLPGRVTPREVLERLEWCEEEESCHCSNHWGRMSGQIQLFLSLGFHNGMHPAVAFWGFMDRARYSRARAGGP